MAFEQQSQQFEKNPSDSILGGRIYKNCNSRNRTNWITIKTPEGQRKLYISASASLPLIYLTDENKPSPMTAPGFCMLLRKYVGNGRITAISQPGLERILFFDIEHLNELGDLCRKLSDRRNHGKHNIIFCDDKDKILDSIPNEFWKSFLKNLFHPGHDVQTDPLTVSFKNFVLALREKPAALWKSNLHKLYRYQSCSSGTYRLGVRLIRIFRLPTFPKICSFTCTASFPAYIEDLKEGNFHPVIYYSNEVPKEFTAIPFSHYGNYRGRMLRFHSRVLRTYYATRNTVTRIRQKSADLRHVVQTNLERARKKYDLQSKQLQGTEDREKYKVYGEPINTYGYNLDPEAKSLTCLNYLIRTKILRFHWIHRKLLRKMHKKYFANTISRSVLLRRCPKSDETAGCISYLESVSNSLDIALSEVIWGCIKEELTASGYVRRKFTKKKVKLTNKPMHYISSDGYDIYVGKNNIQNDELILFCKWR